MFKDLKERTQTYDELIKYFKGTVCEKDAVMDLLLQAHDREIRKLINSKTKMGEWYTFCFARGFSIGSAGMALLTQEPSAWIATGVGSAVTLGSYCMHKSKKLNADLDIKMVDAKFWQNLSEKYVDYKYPFDSSNKDDYEYIKEYLKNPIEFQDRAIVLDESCYEDTTTISEDYMIEK